jgi:hypothetical protein
MPAARVCTGAVPRSGQLHGAQAGFDAHNQGDTVTYLIAFFLAMLAAPSEPWPGYWAQRGKVYDATRLDLAEVALELSKERRELALLNATMVPELDPALSVAILLMERHKDAQVHVKGRLLDEITPTLVRAIRDLRTCRKRLGRI